MNSSYQNILTLLFEGKSDATKQAYHADLDDFRKYLGVETLQDALDDWFYSLSSQASLKALHYKYQLRQKGLKVSTINRRCSMLRGLTNKAHRLGVIQWNLEIESEFHKPDLTSLPIGLRHLMQDLVHFIESEKPLKRAFRDLAILLLVVELGLKTNQLELLQIADVNLVENSMMVSDPATEEKKKRNINKRLQMALLQWLEIRGHKAGSLFQNFDHAKKAKGLTGTSIYRIIKQIGTGIGQDLTPQGLRRLVIQEKITQSGGCPKKMARILEFSGHKSMKSLEIYR